MPNRHYIYIYIYIMNIDDLVWFYDISTTVGYLMPNPIYVLNIYYFIEESLFACGL